MEPDPASALASLGGKGANLVILRDAGFAVPPFVVLTTAEYAAFVADHGLAAIITDALDRPAPEASALIRAAFRQPMSPAQRERIAAAVGPLLDRRLAVRSSATAEDLPEASFAGAQDTVLDVRGLDAVLAACIECWSSLWTERAITYRARNDVPNDAVALAVVVQEFVDAEASGVMFTADPLTGHRGRTSIDAVLGLGEALVSGQVTPEHVEVDTATGRVLTHDVGEGGPTLSQAQIDELVRLGRRIGLLFGSPQDIEWVRVGDELRLVQSRAVTSLYPLPEAAGDDLALWVSFGSVQGVLDPLTPLGADVLRTLIAGAAKAFGRTVDPRSNPFVGVAGERLWLRVDRLVRTAPAPILRAFGIADPAAGAIIASLVDDPAFAVTAPASRLRGVSRALPFLGPVAARATRSIAAPQAARERFTAATEAWLVDVERRFDAAREGDPEQRVRARVEVVRTAIGGGLGHLLPRFGPIMLPSVALLARLRALAAHSGLADADALALTVLRSLPGNVTALMDLDLYATATHLRDDAESRQHFERDDPGDLARAYLEGRLPAVAQRAVGRFLGRYGMRGVAEIDCGTPRWREQPAALMRTLTTYVDLAPEAAPDAQHARGVHDAQAAVDRLAAALPPHQARQARFVAGRLRALFGARETPKFTLVRALGLAREALLDSGADLVAAGRLDQADDIIFLTLEEVADAFTRDVRPLVAGRRASRERERRRSRVPIVLVGDGRTYYGAPAAAGAGDLRGTGVSPGVVEASVRVVRDPATSELQAGEILVCRGTDPAWTPLFLTAAGLVTEVGGLMTHGSVVAREYGLPAVVGVADATTRLTTGARIRLDGTTGAITLLDEP